MSQGNRERKGAIWTAVADGCGNAWSAGTMWHLEVLYEARRRDYALI